MVLPNEIFIAKQTFKCEGCFQWEPPVEFPSCGSICPACQELPSCIGSPPEKSSIVLFFARQDVPVLRLQYWFFSISSKTGFTCLSFSMSTADGSLASPTKVLTKYRTWAKTSQMSPMFFKRIIGIALTWRSNWGKGQIWKGKSHFPQVLSPHLNRQTDKGKGGMGDADKVFVERLDHPVLHPHPTLGVKEGEVVVVACRQDHSLRLNLNQVLPAVGIQKIWEPRTHHWVSAWDHLHILGLLSPEVHCLKSSRRNSVTCSTFGGIFERKGGLLWARYTWYTEISHPIPLLNQMHLLQPRPSPYVYYMLPENQAITLEAFPATSTAMSVPLAPPPRIKTLRSSNCSGFLF